MSKDIDLSELVTQTLLTRQEAAALLRVHVRTIDRWAQEGIIKRVLLKPPGMKQGDPRFLAKDLLAMLTTWEPGQFGRGGLDENPKGRPVRKREDGQEGGTVAP